MLLSIWFVWIIFLLSGCDIFSAEVKHSQNLTIDVNSPNKKTQKKDWDFCYTIPDETQQTKDESCPSEICAYIRTYQKTFPGYFFEPIYKDTEYPVCAPGRLSSCRFINIRHHLRNSPNDSVQCLIYKPNEQYNHSNGQEIIKNP